VALEASSLEALDSRCSALKALGRAAGEGDPLALDVLAKSLEDWHVQVRDAALEALGRVVRHGLPQASGAKLRALQALVPRVRAGHRRAAEVVVSALEDPTDEVVEAAASLLVDLVAPGGRGAAQAEMPARLLGVDCLRRAAGAGDEAASARLVQCMQDWDASIRSAATTAVVELALGHGSGKTGPSSSAVVPPRVRWAAIRALGPLALAGQMEALQALVACSRLGAEEVTCADPGVLAAVLPLQALAIEGLGRMLRDGDSAIPSLVEAKAIAAEAVATSAISGAAGGEWMVAALTTCAADWHIVPRKAALQALARVATSEGASVSFPARSAALHALVPAAMGGDKVALHALTVQSAIAG